MQIDGQCHYGSISYEADIDVSRVLICHCEDCQNFSGSAFRVRIIVASNKFKLTSGSPQTYTKVAQSGAERVMHFCGNCGTHIWCQSRLPWVRDLENIKSIETQNT